MVAELAEGQVATSAHRPERDSRMTLAFKAILEWAQRRGGGIVTGAPFAFQIEIPGYGSWEEAAEARNALLQNFRPISLDLIPKYVEPEIGWLPRGAVSSDGLQLIHHDSNVERQGMPRLLRDTSLDLPFAAVIYGLDDESGSLEYRLLFVFFTD